MSAIDQMAKWAENNDLTFDEYSALVAQYFSDEEFYGRTDLRTCYNHSKGAYSDLNKGDQFPTRIV